MRWLLVSLTLVFSLLVGGCEQTVSSPPETCETRYERNLENGMNATQALGLLTQCLIDEGRLLDLALLVLRLIRDGQEVTAWQPSYYSTSHPWYFSLG